MLQTMEKSRSRVSNRTARQVRRDPLLHPRSRRLHHRSRPKQIRLQVRVELANGKVVVITGTSHGIGAGLRIQRSRIQRRCQCALDRAKFQSEHHQRSRRHWQTGDGRPHHVRAVDLPLGLAIITLGLDRFCAKFYRGDHTYRYS